MAEQTTAAIGAAAIRDAADELHWQRLYDPYGDCICGGTWPCWEHERLHDAATAREEAGRG